VFIHHRNNNIDYNRALVIHVDTLFQKRQPVPRRENWLDSNSLTWNVLRCDGSTWPSAITLQMIYPFNDGKMDLRGMGQIRKYITLNKEKPMHSLPSLKREERQK
jgi:hypothetical protein